MSVPSNPNPAWNIDGVEANEVRDFFIGFKYTEAGNLDMVYYHFEAKTARLYKPVPETDETTDETANCLKMTCMGAGCSAKAELRDDTFLTQGHASACSPPINNGIVKLVEDKGAIRGVGISCELKNCIPKNMTSENRHLLHKVNDNVRYDPVCETPEQQMAVPMVAPEVRVEPSNAPSSNEELSVDVSPSYLLAPPSGTKRAATLPLSPRNTKNDDNQPGENDKKPRLDGENPEDNGPAPKPGNDGE
uniref:C2 domain-containing protein n=1 Tax=Panagrellus redivivus TaxID=6233 RepID=A0A7E4ZUG0_PANRE